MFEDSSSSPPPGCPAHAASAVKVAPEGVRMSRLSPFGLLIEADTERSMDAFDPAQVHALVGRFKVVVFRGFEAKLGEDFPRWCLRLGELLDWEFGTVNTLEIDPEKKNYLYTQAHVPLHWDGAFLHTPPHYIVFQCDEAAPGVGGETTFADTTRVLERVPQAEREAWLDINATYLTEKVVHYGGDFMASVLGEHPVTGEQTLRYAEPVQEINPVTVFLHGLPVERHSAFIERMRERLYDPEVMYAHAWQQGDYVIADNHALLHGRLALKGPERRIRRVNVMTADFDAEGNWVPPVEGASAGLTGVKAPELPEKLAAAGQGFLDFKRQSHPSSFPADFAEYVRSHGPIYHWPYGGFHVITRAADAKAILASKHFTANRATFFVSKMPNVDLDLIGDFFGVVARMMVMSDARVHGMRRKSALHGINNELISSFIPKIRETAGRLIDPLDARGELEFVTEVARPLPSLVLAELFGIPEEDRELFRQCANTMTGFFGGSVEYTNEVAVACNDATITIREYFRKVLDDRRVNPREDFMTGMLEAQQRYNLMDDELISQAAMMLVAGQVTTTDQLCNNLFLMMDVPGLWARLAEDPSLVVNAQEELKRWDPAVTFLFRVAKERQVINGQRIDAGDTVFMSTHALNRDPDEYTQPEVLDITRQNIKHFAYGHGAHYCIGARLGRIVMEELFTAMVTRFPGLHFTPGKPAERDHYSLSFSGFQSLSVSR
ncbi:MAG: cytochrome P450 [Alphaproteobacteria bacterium]|nr:cytochrome P450 [Alphaproteobacteria bacterium]MCB9797270.1 cytochrome P450 [Alphaproteobacteria bacterium]